MCAKTSEQKNEVSRTTDSHGWKRNMVARLPQAGAKSHKLEAGSAVESVPPRSMGEVILQGVAGGVNIKCIYACRTTPRFIRRRQKTECPWHSDGYSYPRPRHRWDRECRGVARCARWRAAAAHSSPG